MAHRSKPPTQAGLAPGVHAQIEALLGEETGLPSAAPAGACFVRAHCLWGRAMEAPRALSASARALRRRCPRIFSLVAAGSLLACLWFAPAGRPHEALAA